MVLRAIVGKVSMLIPTCIYQLSDLICILFHLLTKLGNTRIQIELILGLVEGLDNLQPVSFVALETLIDACLS